jgi:hypothetical protein
VTVVLCLSGPTGKASFPITVSTTSEACAHLLTDPERKACYAAGVAMRQQLGTGVFVTYSTGERFVAVVPEAN